MRGRIEGASANHKAPARAGVQSHPSDLPPAIVPLGVLHLPTHGLPRVPYARASRSCRLEAVQDMQSVTGRIEQAQFAGLMAGANP